MSMRRWWLGLMTVAVALAAPGLPAEAAQRIPKPPLNAPGALDWSSLNLSTEQIRRINLLRLDFQRKAIRLRADIELRRIEIDKLMVSIGADNRLRQLVKERSSLQAQLEMVTLENFLAIKKLLTNDQLEKLPAARLMGTP